MPVVPPNITSVCDEKGEYDRAIADCDEIKGGTSGCSPQPLAHRLTISIS